MDRIKKIRYEDFPDIKKTKIMLMNGLMDLLVERTIDSIPIKELTTYSQVGRKTFYRHYKCKEDIIREYIQILLKEYLNSFPIDHEPTVYNIFIRYFEYWREHNIIIKIMDKNALFFLLLEEYDKIIYWYEERYQNTNTFLVPEFQGTLGQFYNSFNIAGLWYVLILWIKKDMKEPIEDMARLCENIVASQIR